MAVNQITQAFHVTNDELNGGLRVADLVTSTARKFALSLVALATAPITTANFANYNAGSH